MLTSKCTVVGSKTWIYRSCRLLSTPANSDARERRPSQQLPTTPARTRFAPSPTGYLHLGSLRTALFNYLTAKATGGQFILRVEDTDGKRTVKDAESRLYEDLKWAGLQWDEGPDIRGPYGPYKQSERASFYRAHAEKLLDVGHAYRCFCSAERLGALAKQRNKLGIPSNYDRTCVNITKEEVDARVSKGDPNVVRLKLPDVPPVYKDLIYGVVGGPRQKAGFRAQHSPPSYEDPILVKSDGLPTYHLANVVDDHCMKITHVIRAVEWMPSTPKHMVLYNAFEWEPPIFAHVGLLQDSSQQKLSKRDASMDIRSFRDKGYFADALVNYVALFGWSHKLGDDFINLPELIKTFDLKFTRGNTIAAPAKLLHLQKRYAQKYVRDGGQECESIIDKLHTIAEQHVKEHPENQICRLEEIRNRAADLLRVDAANYTTPSEFFDRNLHFFCSQPRTDWKRSPQDRLLKENLTMLEIHFRAVTPEQWDEANLKHASDRVADILSANLQDDSEFRHDKGIDRAKVLLMSFLRWALTGNRPSTSLLPTMRILGRGVSLQRIEDAAASLDELFIETQEVSA